MAKALDLQIEIALAGKDQNWNQRSATLTQSHAAALLITADPFFDTRRDRIIALARTIQGAGHLSVSRLCSCGRVGKLWRKPADGYSQVGIMLAKSSKVTSRAICPIYQATEFEFVIDLKTAQDARSPGAADAFSTADEVIE